MAALYCRNASRLPLKLMRAKSTGKRATTSAITQRIRLCATRYARSSFLCRRLVAKRGLLTHAAAGKSAALERALLAEETAERKRDKHYWLPLLKELERLRHAR